MVRLAPPHEVRWIPGTRPGMTFLLGLCANTSSARREQSPVIAGVDLEPLGVAACRALCILFEIPCQLLWRDVGEPVNLMRIGADTAVVLALRDLHDLVLDQTSSDDCRVF